MSRADAATLSIVVGLLVVAVSAVFLATSARRKQTPPPPPPPTPPPRQRLASTPTPTSPIKCPPASKALSIDVRIRDTTFHVALHRATLRKVSGTIVADTIYSVPIATTKPEEMVCGFLGHVDDHLRFFNEQFKIIGSVALIPPDGTPVEIDFHTALVVGSWAGGTGVMTTIMALIANGGMLSSATGLGEAVILGVWGGMGIFAVVTLSLVIAAIVIAIEEWVETEESSYAHPVLLPWIYQENGPIYVDAGTVSAFEGVGSVIQTYPTHQIQTVGFGKAVRSIRKKKSGLSLFNGCPFMTTRQLVLLLASLGANLSFDPSADTKVKYGTPCRLTGEQILCPMSGPAAASCAAQNDCDASQTCHNGVQEMVACTPRQPYQLDEHNLPKFGCPDEETPCCAPGFCVKGRDQPCERCAYEVDPQTQLPLRGCGPTKGGVCCKASFCQTHDGDSCVACAK